MSQDHSVEKIVIIAGTTGIGLKRLYNCLNNKKLSVGENVCVYHFEDLLEEEYGDKGRCRDIEQLIAMMLTSRPAAISVFRRGVDRLRERLRYRSCRKAIVFAHLTYLSRRMIVANPVISELLSLGKEASVIYMVDDFFDALKRMSLNASNRLMSGGKCIGLPITPYNIDPVLYLTWRAADSNILSIVESIKPGTEIYVYGVKHPAREFSKLLSRVLKTKEEYLIDSKPSTAYVSHPITQVRSLYVALGDRPLSDIPIVKAIEAFKEAIRSKNPDLVLFEPTTIDELHQDKFSEFAKYVTQVETGFSDLIPGKNTKRVDTTSDKPLLHSLFVNSNNRWPFSDDNLREFCADERVYNYADGEGGVGLLDAEMTVIYGEELYHNIVIDIIINNLLMEEALNEGRMKGMLATQLNDLIHAQIEERDYAYVAQSDHVIAVTTGVIVDREFSEATGVPEGVYIPWSTGMDAEIQRARALAKPITYYILPICAKSLVSNHDRLQRIARVLKEGFKHCPEPTSQCSEDEAIETIRKCAVRIQKGGLFATIGGGVRVCPVPVLLKGEESFEELIDRYSKALC